MKKIYLALFLMGALVSCKKNSSETTMDGDSYNLKLRERAKEVGIDHNNGMDYFLAGNSVLNQAHRSGINKKISFSRNAKSGKMESSERAPIWQSYTSKQIYSYAKAFGNPLTKGSSTVPEIEYDPEMIAKLDYLKEHSDPASIQAMWTEEISTLSNNPLLLTSRETGMVNELKAIFSTVYSLGMTQGYAYNFFKMEFKRLEDKYQFLSFNENEGELFLGLLNIAKSSNEYWHVGSPSFDLPPVDPNELEPVIVQVDLIGYIVGWGKAVWADYDSGNLHSTGQWRRIKAGGSNAIGTSFTSWAAAFTKKFDIPAPILVLPSDTTISPFPKPTDPFFPNPNPETGFVINPNTGTPVINPQTGQGYDIRYFELDINPQTGQPIYDPFTMQPRVRFRIA